ncbi:MAG: hypothetical protein JRH16_17185 [Deltaproteobacteria bacterium]|nr:hypothetical protein [Deltaproteobacteria bacterium]MBW2418973.1 hypothetical protein [Deltaproteobacteria bacterium]
MKIDIFCNVFPPCYAAALRARAGHCVSVTLGLGHPLRSVEEMTISETDREAIFEATKRASTLKPCS